MILQPTILCFIFPNNIFYYLTSSYISVYCLFLLPSHHILNVNKYLLNRWIQRLPYGQLDGADMTKDLNDGADTVGALAPQSFHVLETPNCQCAHCCPQGISCPEPQKTLLSKRSRPEAPERHSTPWEWYLIKDHQVSEYKHRRALGSRMR